MFEVLAIITVQLIWSGYCVWLGTALERRAMARRKRTALGQHDVAQSAFDRANEAAGV